MYVGVVKSKQCNSGPARERYLGGKFLTGDLQGGGEICRVADPTMAGVAMQKANAGPS